MPGPQGVHPSLLLSEPPLAKLRLVRAFAEKKIGQVIFDGEIRIMAITCGFSRDTPSKHSLMRDFLTVSKCKSGVDLDLTGVRVGVGVRLDE